MTSHNINRSIAKLVFERTLFYGRGFSRRTIERLISCGIDAPERLLFMEKNELRRIAKGSTREINAYRETFLPKAKSPATHVSGNSCKSDESVLSDLPQPTTNVIEG
jgi:hypothetical protein